MRKKLAIPFVAAAIVATALAVPAANAREQNARDTKPAAGPPTSSTTAETCTQVRQNFKAMARAGAKKAYCSGGAHAVADFAATDVATAAEDPPLNPICKSALGRPPDAWPMNRTETCAVFGVWIFAYSLETGAVIGKMEIRHVSYYATDLNFSAFRLLFYAKVFQIIGVGFEDAMIEGTPKCYDGHAGQAGCAIDPPSFEAQPLNRKNAVWSVSAGFQSGVDLPGEIQHLGGWLEWKFYSAAGVPMGEPDYTSVPPHQVQCDWTSEEGEDSPAGSPGCVLDDYVPIFEVYVSRYPSFYNHIVAAQAAGLPKRLTRMIHRDRREANGNAACPRRYARPPDHECDEYPFRSTLQGAGEVLRDYPFAIGTTYSWCQLPDLPQDVSGAGWSSCMIPKQDNRYGGIDLGQFYARNRLITGDVFEVVPVLG